MSKLTMENAQRLQDANWAFRNQPTSAMVEQAIIALDGVADCLQELMESEEEEGELLNALSILHLMRARNEANRGISK